MNSPYGIIVFQQQRYCRTCAIAIIQSTLGKMDTCTHDDDMTTRLLALVFFNTNIFWDIIMIILTGKLSTSVWKKLF